ncbi:hypothetical protein A8C56_10785 [Niabella ginsenosidivorans]|uniref:HTH tetR-type domain-containing protein n=1 Tax=Niabella ginsenosidivorans TaxID=1176587 RepID=A0A1A9I253_9BACT|nr:TetR/AcrR family transcriptional regulator [Niabella ginsenosidivorans]ANH81405.1 hypothetical protein A8C56_10785 [Niabella ginsenosidivorans]
MDTKNRILQAALLLYNSKGIDVVTTRHIAASISISPGNLHYHFKHTNDIIIALYSQLAAGFDKEIIQIGDCEPVDMGAVLELATRSFRLMYRYRFIFLHFVEIAARIPFIREDYEKVTERRTKELTKLFRRLVKNGTFRSDLKNEIWPALIKQLFIVADFWLSHNELTSRLRDREAEAAYRNTFRFLFLPFLRLK